MSGFPVRGFLLVFVWARRPQNFHQGSRLPNCRCKLETVIGGGCTTRRSLPKCHALQCL